MCEKGGGEGAESRFGGEFISLLPGASRENRKQKMLQFPFIPEPQEESLLPITLSAPHLPFSPPKPQSVS